MYEIALTAEFIDKVAAKANEICEEEGKKTINNEHLYKSLKVSVCLCRNWGWRVS